MADSATRSRHILLLRADPHRWGMGLIHQIDPDRDQTLCGKSPASCPGDRFEGPASAISCKSCLRSIEAKQKYEQIMREVRAREQRREEVRAQWWYHYNQYLLTETWKRKRAAVMRRANGLCEGCGERRAIQVHYLRYPQDCNPGSAEWIAREKLFDLRAICLACHDDVHGLG